LKLYVHGYGKAAIGDPIKFPDMKGIETQWDWLL